ncbi:uncharacterized protein RHOBADRAFT_36193 [Rhodotorula graminis WP1]|uniref:EamA domain-containing protein n=1 Tax=Rhodotorula graminis (strain WP1) TaxID=578459 RepID=A0A194S3N6_RHOGW|nr:uncharacterized protein RHOBADRAFT_36193 [Rhodotorula graminis WP1]KPV75348.1 hypothetical protein RHOBADRAFT_36193 [Rhodotorula graminis WP1]
MLGTALLVLVVLLWVAASFLMNIVFTDMAYDKPFLVTWLCTASFSLYLVRPGWRLARPHLRGRRDTNRSLSRVRPSRNDMGRYLPAVPVVAVDPPLTTRETALLSLLFCGLWFAANWAMNAALGFTSVSSTTILSSMSGFFTLAAGACAGVESFSVGKLVSVALSITGVTIVSLSDSKLPARPVEPASSNPLLGDALALLSALAYAAYVLLLKVRIRNEQRVSMTLFFGFVGLFNILLIWPVGVLLHLLGVETFEMPHGKLLWASLLVNAAITFVSDALYLRAMLLTSPLAVTLGLSLTIPLALAGDVLFRRSGEPTSLASLVGAALVLGSFVANGVLDLREAERETEELEEGASVAVAEEEEEEEDAVGEGEDERERLLSRRASMEEEERGGRGTGPGRQLD